MSYIETLNLIDFGTEDVKQTTLEHKVKESIPSTLISKEPTPTLVPHVSPVSFSCLNVTAQEHRRESLDNNPFDSVQKLANRPDDPFEIVEKEACQKARSSQIPVDVKLGNLLSLSDDNLLDDVDTQLHDKFSSCITENNNESPKYVSDFTAYSNGTSSIYNTANTCNILDSESPPISLSQKWTTDSGNSSESVGGSASSTDAGNSAKTKKAIEYRKRLLKLSISNSTFNSPVSRRMPQQSDDFAETNNISMILTEAAQVGEHLIAAESPLKLVDDDLMAEEPNWIDSEKDFDDDLEMLKIPMLKELPTPIVEEQKSLVTELQINADENIETKDAAPLTDLAAIRAKLKAKRELSNNNQDISLLIDSLKSLIADINVGDANKKQQAASLLDTLSSALSSGGSKKSEEITTQPEDAEVLTSVLQPQPIVRQGTFDIELQEKEQQKNKNSDEDNGNFDQDPSSPQSVQTGIRCEEMPDAMIKSSATYDGENTDEKQEFILPEIQPLTQSQLDVNDIVDQLGKLLEQHQLNNNKHNAEIGVDGGASQAANINPTFIVVMNTTPATLTTASVQQHCSYMASCLENSFNDGSPTINSHSNSMMRRRSQSLSIHDKVKVLQLPMISNNVVSTAAECDRQVNVSPEVTPFDAEGAEFKTPSRAMVRRNSFSSGTPFTPIHSHFGTVAAQRRASGMSDTSSQIQMRRPTTLTTHHESQLNLSSTSAIVRPMQHLNLNSLKPDLTNKKKFKSSNSSESILKSSGPMKATIPVKKVAPMLKTSQPIPDSAVFKTKLTSSLNSSMQLTAMAGKIPHTSTPMPQPRGTTVALDIAPGLPNACSTPSVRTSPMKRSMTNASKRYSYLSATPSVKRSVSTSATASGLRRRTLCELKPKSPIKPRISSIGGAASIVTNSTGKTTGVARNSAKITSNVSKTVQNKSAPTPSTRTSSRLSSRTSFAGTTAPKRNKENKQP